MSNKTFQLAFEIGGKVAASLPRSFSVAAEAVGKLNKELASIKTQQESVKRLQDMKTQVGETAREFAQASRRVEELGAEIRQTENPTKAMIRDFERAQTKSSNLRETLKNQRLELANLKRAYGGANTTAKGLAAEMARLKIASDNNRASQGRAVEQVNRYNRALSESRRLIIETKRAQDELNKAESAKLSERHASNRKGLMVSGAATAAVGGGAFMAAKQAAEYNRENQLIGNTAAMTAKQIAEMGQAMMYTANATGQTTADVQAAEGYLVAAGQDAKTAQANLMTIGKTATATGSDILDVAKSSFTLSDALKIKPDGMKQALDILVQAGKEGNFEFNDMAKSLPVLGAQFQALKMSGKEAAATMGAALQIARKGSSSSDEAANNMNNFMAKILAPGTLKAAKKKFHTDLYGIVTHAQKTGQNPFEAAMKAVMKMTKGGNQKLLGELFGDMQVQNFLRPMIQNYQEYLDIKNKSLSSKGGIDKDFSAMSQQNAQRLKEFNIGISNLSLSVGQSLQPAFALLLKTINPIIKDIGDFVTKHSELIGQVIVATTVTLAFVTAINAVRYAITGLKLATAAFNIVLNMTPIGWIRLAIIALVFAGTLLIQNWDTVKAKAVVVWGYVKEYTVKAFDFLKNIFMNFTPAGWILQAFQAAWDVLKSIDWTKPGEQIIQSIINGIKAKASGLVDEVKSLYNDIAQYVPGLSPLDTKTGVGAASGTPSPLRVPGSNGLNVQVNQNIHLPAGSPADTKAAAQAGAKAGNDDLEAKMKHLHTQQRRLSYG